MHCGLRLPTLNMLLKEGADPNRRHLDGTLFDVLLEWLHFVREDYKEDSQMMCLFNILDMLTKHGATPNLYRFSDKRRLTLLEDAGPSSTQLDRCSFRARQTNLL